MVIFLTVGFKDFIAGSTLARRVLASPLFPRISPDGCISVSDRRGYFKLRHTDGDLKALDKQAM